MQVMMYYIEGIIIILIKTVNTIQGCGTDREVLDTTESILIIKGNTGMFCR